MDVGFHCFGLARSLAGTGESAGQPGFGSSTSCSRASVISRVQSQWRARRRIRRRPVVTSWLAAENRRSRSRRGSSAGSCRSGRARASRPPSRGRSGRSPTRCRSARCGAGAGCAVRSHGRPGCGPPRWPAAGGRVRVRRRRLPVLAAKQVIRKPSASVILNWAAGEERMALLPAPRESAARWEAAGTVWGSSAWAAGCSRNRRPR